MNNAKRPTENGMSKTEFFIQSLRVEVEWLQADVLEASQGFIERSQAMHRELQRGELPGTMRLTPDMLGDFYVKLAKLEAKRAALAALESAPAA